jgi:[acyl-carrier-protein] S-malonyltransferase
MTDRALVLVFEGQGARTVPPTHLEAIARLVSGITVVDKPIDLTSVKPSVAQQLIVAHQVCQASAFAADANVVGVSGQSLGELAALVAAGALTVEQALTVARLRADIPATVLADRHWAMVSLTRVAVGVAQEVASDVGGWVIAHNGPVDTVVVLEADRLDAFIDGVRADPSIYRILPVRYPYHTPVMAPVAEAVADAVAALPIEAPSVPVVSPIGPSEPTSADDVRRAIVDALTRPVLWSTALRRAAARWPTALWCECGPSNGLRRFVSKNRLQLDWHSTE